MVCVLSGMICGEVSRTPDLIAHPAQNDKPLPPPPPPLRDSDTDQLVVRDRSHLTHPLYHVHHRIVIPAPVGGYDHRKRQQREGAPPSQHAASASRMPGVVCGSVLCPFEPFELCLLDLWKGRLRRCAGTAQTR